MVRVARLRPEVGEYVGSDRWVGDGWGEGVQWTAYCRGRRGILEIASMWRALGLEDAESCGLGG